MNRSIISKETESVVKKLPKKESLGPDDGFTGKFYQTFKKELIPVLGKLFPKIEEKGTFSKSFYGGQHHPIPKPEKGAHTHTDTKTLQTNIFYEH